MEHDEGGLVQRIEDEFGISISEEEASQTCTAGDVFRLVSGKLDQAASSLSARASYVTRRALSEALRVPRRGIGPGTALEPLLPLSSRREHWNSIVERAGVRFPRLSHSRHCKDRILLASMAIAAAPVIALWWALYALGWIHGVGVPLFSMPASLAWLLLVSRIDKDLLLATPGLASVLPFETAGELSLGVLAMNLAAFQTGPGKTEPPSGDMVWTRILDILEKHARLPREAIVPESVLAAAVRVE